MHNILHTKLSALLYKILTADFSRISLFLSIEGLVIRTFLMNESLPFTFNDHIIQGVGQYRLIDSSVNC